MIFHNMRLYSKKRLFYQKALSKYIIKLHKHYYYSKLYIIESDKLFQKFFKYEKLI